MEVKEFKNGRVVLSLPMNTSIEPGDQFEIIAGCDKTKTSCKNKFNNLINFRGFPDIPGSDKMLKTSGTMDRE